VGQLPRGAKTPGGADERPKEKKNEETKKKNRKSRKRSKKVSRRWAFVEIFEHLRGGLLFRKGRLLSDYFYRQKAYFHYYLLAGALEKAPLPQANFSRLKLQY
jgi:hypothetical protein